MDPVAPDNVQMAFEPLQRGRLHGLLGQPVPVLSHSYSEKGILGAHLEHSLFQLMSFSSCFVTWALLKKASLHPPHTLSLCSSIHK